MDIWCDSTCQAIPPYCPETHCACQENWRKRRDTGENNGTGTIHTWQENGTNFTTGTDFTLPNLLHVNTGMNFTTQNVSGWNTGTNSTLQNVSDGNAGTNLTLQLQWNTGSKSDTTLRR